ncbi:hypothetical protein ACFLIM_42975 [Nonomuraea sp. M3C6]|uniref:Uncharacterized protein n=1 Tax=Nonomuraea marmarensis TaxID=3351344 RepID=A0ABW7AUP4_9ACTN
MAGRSRHARRRRRTGRRRLVVGALALAGGVAGLLGSNGTLGGVLTASRSSSSERPGGAGAAGQQARAEQENRASALSGEVGARPRASAEAEARELRVSEPPKATATPGTATPGTVEPGLVEGIIDSGDPPESDSEPGSSGYKADGPSRHTDRQAAEYFRTHWGPDDKALKRLKDIRTVGGYLRIYTDLPETAHNSRQAITLCKRGLEYLRAAGVANPVVFVQAGFGENGNPVLANILGPSDPNCRVTHPTPD